MRISPLPQIHLALLWIALGSLAGCGIQVSQSTADKLQIEASSSVAAVGQSVTIKATLTLGNGVKEDVTQWTRWTLSDPSMGSVAGNVIVPEAPGDLTVQGAYSVAHTASGQSASSGAAQTIRSSIQLKVTGAGALASAITWNPPAPIQYGTPLGSAQLNATANVPGTFSYSPGAGAVLQAGEQTLTATFTPAKGGQAASAVATVTLSVNKATPVINWAPAPTMQPGTALGPAELDATANVPGAIVYNPSVGAVMSAGVQALTAAFTPNDSADYTPVVARSQVIVGSASAAPTGPVIGVNPGMSTAALQTAISGAPSGATISFASGSYNITSTLQIPCNNLQLTGPAGSSPTAILAASFTGQIILGYPWGCSSLGSVQYLQFENTGAVYVGGGSANFIFEHNVVTHLPSSLGGAYSEAEAGVFLDGNLIPATTTSNILIAYNTFGDPSSCSAVFTTGTDEGGYCAGVLTHTALNENLTIEYNNFIHVEEGIHFIQIASYHPGSPASACSTCVVEYNYIYNYHRIGFEFQIVATNELYFEHNAIVDPLGASYGTFAISLACCTYLTDQQAPGYSPAYSLNDNVLLATVAGYQCPPFGVEFWGDGATGTNSLVQGLFCNGYTWGYGAAPWAISNNYICGPNFADGGGYISNEEHQNNPPAQSGNVTAPGCSATASTAPSISPAGGSFSGSQTVSLIDTGPNTGIWYTTDGSTPVPGSGTAQIYTGPITLTGGTTVKAVGMWGAANQPTSYPAGYGYIPSSVVTATFAPAAAFKRASATAASPSGGAAAMAAPASHAAGGAAAIPVPNPVLQSVSIAPASSSVAIGESIQVKATAVYSDGSSRDVTGSFLWNSSDERTIAVSPSGAVSGLASGRAALYGSYDGMQASAEASSAIGDVQWSGPLVIARGGVYTGNWQSTDAKTPAVSIATTEPVVIENSRIRGVGALIQSARDGADLTVRNSIGVGLTPAAKGQPNGDFLDASSPSHLDVENNYMENLRYGVVVNGFSPGAAGERTLTIRANRARNISSRLGDGAGGYLPAGMGQSAVSSFVKLEDLHSVPGIDVGWNEIVDSSALNPPDAVIELYRSSGTVNQPLDLHDSYIQSIAAPQSSGDAFHGAGIKIDGAPEDTEQNASAFAFVHRNQVVGAFAFGIAIAAGHDNLAANNRVFSSGVFADGAKSRAPGAGLSIADAYGNLERGSSYNNSMQDNLAGWQCWSAACADQGYRRDLYLPASPADYSTNAAVTAGKITPAMEEGEYQLWLRKASSAGVQVGPSF